MIVQLCPPGIPLAASASIRCLVPLECAGSEDPGNNGEDRGRTMRKTALAMAAVALAAMAPQVQAQDDDMDVWANKFDEVGKPTGMKLLFDRNGAIYATDDGLEQCDGQQIMLRGVDRQGSVSNTFAYEYADAFVDAFLSDMNVVLLARVDPSSKVCFAYGMQVMLRGSGG